MRCRGDLEWRGAVLLHPALRRCARGAEVHAEVLEY